MFTMRNNHLAVAAVLAAALTGLAGCGAATHSAAPVTPAVQVAVAETTSTTSAPAPVPVTMPPPDQTPPSTSPADQPVVSIASIDAGVQALTTALSQMDSDLSTADKAAASGG